MSDVSSGDSNRGLAPASEGSNTGRDHPVVASDSSTDKHLSTLGVNFMLQEPLPEKDTSLNTRTCEMCGLTLEIGKDDPIKGSIDRTHFGVLCSGCYWDTLELKQTGQTYEDRNREYGIQ